MRWRAILVLLAAVLSPAGVSAGPPAKAAFDTHKLKSATPQQRATLEAYLAAHPRFRLAADADCACADDLAHQRTPEEDTGGPASVDRQAAYDPYLAIGDFNGDGAADLAAMFVDTAAPDKEKPAVLAIFNGPFVAPPKPPAFEEKNDPVKGVALFHSVAPGGHLVIGIFESEGCLFNAKGRAYVRVCQED